MEDIYFKNDEYWKEHINKKLEDDIWIKNYREYFNGKGKCLDLGCGIGQYSKELMSYGYEVISADISDIALEKVKEFNDNVVKVDMKEELPFSEKEFDLVFANLSIHYFSDEDTKKLMLEIKRILKEDGLFIGSVNGIQGYEKIKDTAVELEKHYWFNKNKYVRLFDKDDLEKYLDVFEILNIEEKETVRFNHKKNYLVFFVKKN
ncbi:MAG: class I SAM-dependent methyltransferase [Bacilli bacterium]|nr:class I SAM-dependent methyltransferase [Bacilli bacterium]